MAIWPLGQMEQLENLACELEPEMVVVVGERGKVEFAGTA